MLAWYVQHLSATLSSCLVLHVSPGVSKWEPLIYSSMFVAKQGGHLDFGSHCTVLDLPDPELFSSQTCCWCICRKRTIIFFVLLPEYPRITSSVFTVQTTSGLIPAGLQACSLMIRCSRGLKDNSGWKGEVTAVVSVWYLPWHSTVVFQDGCGAGIAEECDREMVLGNWGHGEGQFHFAFCYDLVHVQGPV